MTKTPRVPYEPVEDIPNLNKASIDARREDALMQRVINSTRFSLKRPNNLKKHSVYNWLLNGLLRDQLLMSVITHSSIREVVSVSVKKKYYPLVGDALSLAREQVEKIFIVASLIDNPTQGFKQYIRNTVKTEYEEYWLGLEEQAENERFSEFLSTTLPKRLERMRRPEFKKGKKETFVSDYALKVLKLNWDDPGAKNPSWFKQNKKKDLNVLRYIQNYFDFATPGKSAKKITDPKLKRFLYRWHKEYTFLSQYTHVRVGKLRFADMHQQKNMTVQENVTNYGKRLAGRAINTSYTAIATSCALVLNAVHNDYGAKAELEELWEKLIGFSLLSKALWKMHVEELLK